MTEEKRPVWKCDECGSTYPTPEKARECEEEHYELARYGIPGTVVWIDIGGMVSEMGHEYRQIEYVQGKVLRSRGGSKERDIAALVEYGDGERRWYYAYVLRDVQKARTFAESVRGRIGR